MGKTTKLTCDDGVTIGAYEAAPDGTPKGGVVVIQEIFGVNSHIRSVADMYAAEGYLAVAPAIFDRSEPGVELGYTDADMGKGFPIALGLDRDKLLLDVAAAAKVASAAGKVGVVGFCYGGMVTALSAIRLGNVFAAASSYYGGNAVSLIGEKPAVPMIMHFGALDAHIPLSDVEKIEEAWPDVTVYVYDDADHGFNCDARGAFHEASRDLARQRTLAFFAEHLV